MIDFVLLSCSDIGCSADASLQGYAAYFNTGKTDSNEHIQENAFNEFNPNACLRLQLGAQYPYQQYDQTMLSENPFNTQVDNSIQGNTIDYQVNQFEPSRLAYDASFQNWASAAGTCGVAIYDDQSYSHVSLLI